MTYAMQGKHPAGRLFIPAIVLTLLACSIARGQAAERPEKTVTATLAQQQGVAVTVYNSDLALIKDRRRVTLPPGRSELAFRDVSAKLRPETALLRDTDARGAPQVLEQNFDFALLTPAELIAKHVGRDVTLATVNPATGKERRERATLLANNSGLVLRVGDHIETNPPGRLLFDRLPPDLRDRPTLSLDLATAKGGARDLELTYLTGGLAWRADYVAELNADDSSLDLRGWVTLTNRSGTAYRNARLQLVAGDVNRVTPRPRRMAEERVLMAMADAPAKAMQQEKLFAYHLYTLPRATTLADQQTKQLALLEASAVPLDKTLLLQGAQHYYRGAAGEIGRKLKVAVQVHFANDEKGHLGLPLPAGIVRVYKRDSQGGAQFVGEDRIDHTARNDKVSLHLGNAFDVTARKVQTDYRKRRAAGGTYNYAAESSYRITLNNGGREAVMVTVREPIPGDWRMLDESLPHEKVAAHTAQWQVPVPADGKAELTYRVLVRY